MADDDYGKHNDADLIKRTREAALDTAVQQLRLIYTLKQRNAQAACPPPRSSACSSSPAPGTTPHPPPKKTDASDLLFDVARLSLLNHEQWVKLSHHHFGLIVDTLRRLGGQAAEVSQLALVTHGTPGKSTEPARFVIENPLSHRAQVSLTPPVLHRVGGGQPLKASVTVQRVDDDGNAIANGFLLEPRESGRFQLVAAIQKTAAVGTYRGETPVSVGVQTVGRLCVTIEVGR